MQVEEYNYNDGLSIVPEDIKHKTITIFAEYPNKLTKSNVSLVKDDLKDKLLLEGWSGEYRLDTESKITITSYQKRIGLCFQTGNVGRVYADLLKLQSLFAKGNIDAGIFLLPKRKMTRVFGSNCASYERLLKELPIFSQVISIPLVIIGFEEREE